MNSKERHEIRYQRRKAKRIQKINERSAKYTAFDNIFGLIPMSRAFLDGRKGTRWKPSTQIFGANLILNLEKEIEKLKNGTWKGYGFHRFSIHERGKLRWIQSVKIPEKTVQRTFCDNCLIPIIRPHLIYDNSASIKGKGTDFCLRRFSEHLQWHIRRYGVSGGIFFFDFHSYFKLIDHRPLKDDVARLVKTTFAIHLYNLLIDAFGETGLGLGSQVSQISAVYFPNSTDHLIKDQMSIHCYGRYNDDGYIILPSYKDLEHARDLFLSSIKERGIVPNEKKCRIVSLKSHFTFLKKRFHITKTGKIIIRPVRAAVTRERHRLRKFKGFVKQGIMSFTEAELAFHSWLTSMAKGRDFHIIVNTIHYFDELFQEYGYYKPRKRKNRRQNRRYRMIRFANKVALYEMRKAA